MKSKLSKHSAMLKIVIYFLLYVPFILSGQNKDTLNLNHINYYKHELGIKIISVSQDEYCNYLSNPLDNIDKFHCDYFNGIIYNYRLTKGFYLTSLIEGNYKKYNKYSFFHQNDDDKDIGSQRYIGIKIGIEKRFLKRNIHPFICISNVFNFIQMKGTEHRTFEYYYSINYNKHNYQIGISPAMGIIYQPVSRLLISLEISANVLYNNSIGNYIIIETDDGRTYKGSIKSNYFSAYLYPLTLFSVSYNFN